MQHRLNVEFLFEIELKKNVSRSTIRECDIFTDGYRYRLEKYENTRGKTEINTVEFKSVGMYGSFHRIDA